MIFNLLTQGGSGTGAGSGSTPQPTGNPISLIVMGVLVVAIVIMFIMSSRSNKKKRKEAQEVLENLKIGDRVKTIGGICGFVAQINDAENTFVLETGLEENKSYVKFDKQAIYQTAPANGNAAKEEKAEKEEKDY